MALPQTQLLDLSDDLIRHIAHLLSPETYLPDHTFLPFSLDISTKFSCDASKDLRSFRSTCRQIRDVVPLDGLHVTIKGEAGLDRWASEAPQPVLRAVRRLAISDCTEENLEARDRWNVGDVPLRWRYPYDAEGYLESTMTFISRLSHLRELILLEIPSGVSSAFGNYEQPLEDEGWHGQHAPLQQLESISLDGSWTRYGNISSYLFALAPNVTAAKLMLYPPGEHRSSRYAWDDHLTYCSQRNNPNGTLRTVYLSLVWGTGTDGDDAIYIISSIASRFPEVEHLEIRTACRLSPLALDVDEASMQVSVTPTDPEDQNGWSVEKLLDALKLMKKLRIFDAMLNVHVNDGPPRHDIVHRGTTPDDIEDMLSQASSMAAQIEQWECMERRAQEWMAQRMVQACPTLRQGWWWMEDEEWAPARRRGWSVSDGSERTENPLVVMDKVDLRLYRHVVSLM
ncbi:hypothetical protein JCM24511_02781 [Saitozyma sp. JCM 24511]|nr:hypothetical protein JCM24511_02781 [Saitozyma sp. JCM 24511]